MQGKLSDMKQIKTNIYQCQTALKRWWKQQLVTTRNSLSVNNILVKYTLNKLKCQK